MSLPTAQKDISDKPAPGSVVDPVNKASKDADLERKIRLYGVVEAFRQGRMPSNTQINETLTYIADHSPVDTSKLSRDGQNLVQDIRYIVETARLMVAEKNADELLQNFVWHTRDVDVSQAKKDPNDVLPVDKEKAKDDGQQAVRHLRAILSLILTNSEVRKLLSDFSLIGRDLLARGASKAAEALRPDHEALAHVDDSAPQDQFITEGGRPVGHHETPVLEAKVPGTDTTVRQHPHDHLGTGATVEGADGNVRSGKETYEHVNGQVGNVKENGQRLKDEAVEQVPSGITNGGPTEEKKQGLVDRMKGIRDGITDRIPQQHKDTAHDHLERGHHFLTEEYFPEERRDQFIYRGKKVIIECQKNDNYQESIRWLLSYLKEYAGHGKSVAGHGKESHTALTSDPALKQATKELRTLLERFANGQSIDVIIDAVHKLRDDAKEDQEFREWFKKVDGYIRRVLLEPSFVLEPLCGSQGTDLKESGRKFYDDKYKANFENLFATVGDWFKAMGEDPLNKRFGEDWARLTRDLLFDSEGSLKFKPELWMDVRKVILPTLADKIGYIPIPRIEYTDDSLDLVIENLTLSGRNLFPNIISLEAHNFVKFSPYSSIHDEHHHEFTLTLGQMQADMRDVAFYYKKKSGIPKWSDSGLADVVLGGEGLTATVHLVSAHSKDRSSVFRVKDVHVKVDKSLKFSIRDSKHDFLYKTLSPLATGLVKKQVKKALRGTIWTGLEFVDGRLVEVRDRLERAKASDGDESRTQVLQDLFKKKEEETGSDKSHVDKHSKFKVVSSKQQSSLASTGHPAGWVNRAMERDEMALRGQDWRSEAFNIV